MYEGNSRFAPVHAEASAFPLVVNYDKAEDLRSLVTISLARAPRVYGYSKRGLEFDKEFLYLFNGNLRAEFNGTAANSMINIPHKFARDIEGDQAYGASVALDSVTPTYISGNYATYSAYVTGMALYMNAAESPLTDAVEESEKEEYPNYGYPYQPPGVTIEGSGYPFKVNITTYFLSPQELQDWYEKLMKKANS